MLFSVVVPRQLTVKTGHCCRACRHHCSAGGPSQDAGCPGAGNQLRAATALVVAGLLQRLFLQDLNGMLDDMRRLQRSMARSRAPARPDTSSPHTLATVPKRSINVTANPLGMPGARCGAGTPLSRCTRRVCVCVCVCVLSVAIGSSGCPLAATMHLRLCEQKPALLRDGAVALASHAGLAAAGSSGRYHLLRVSASFLSCRPLFPVS